MEENNKEQDLMMKKILGEKLFNEICSACHGKNGEGNADAFFPKIQGQHYAYLLRQLKWIRDGRRKNANATMFTLIEKMDDEEKNKILEKIKKQEALIEEEKKREE